MSSDSVPPPIREASTGYGAPIKYFAVGAGEPVVVLHDELGFPGFTSWHDRLADRGLQQIIPLQPGYGDSAPQPWMRGYRDLASVYADLVRRLELGPVHIVGFSAGAFIGAEVAAACPDLIKTLTLVGPLGLRPTQGEIFDFLAISARRHVAATVSHPQAPDARQIYGGEMTADQFERFELARAEVARLGWQPFMFDDTLGPRLSSLRDVPTLLVRGDDDQVCPAGCITAYQQAIPHAQVCQIAQAGHRPEVEQPADFVDVVVAFIENAQEG